MDRVRVIHPRGRASEPDADPRELDQALDRVRSLVRDRAAEQEARITSLEQDLRDTEQLLMAAEQQAARLASLYAAAYQLHSLDPLEVQAAIGEIAVDLLGARRSVLLMTKEPGVHDVVELPADARAPAPFDRGTYTGGDPMVDAAIADGCPRTTRIGTSPAVAVVPFTMQANVVGALVMLELVPHKSALGWQDRELIDLLIAHAASALLGARVFHDTQRKLKTLESVVGLLRRPGGAK